MKTILAGMAVVGVPGFASFVAEALTLFGTFRSQPGASFVVLAGLALLAVALAYAFPSLLPSFAILSSVRSSNAPNGLSPFSSPYRTSRSTRNYLAPPISTGCGHIATKPSPSKPAKSSTPCRARGKPKSTVPWLGKSSTSWRATAAGRGGSYRRRS